MNRSVYCRYSHKKFKTLKYFWEDWYPAFRLLEFIVYCIAIHESKSFMISNYIFLV